jgi:hypothetical protein
MNSYPDMMLQAAIRYRADQIADDWAPSRRRRSRRRAERRMDRSRAPRADVA